MGQSSSKSKIAGLQRIGFVSNLYNRKTLQKSDIPSKNSKCMSDKIKVYLQVISRANNNFEISS